MSEVEFRRHVVDNHLDEDEIQPYMDKMYRHMEQVNKAQTMAAMGVPPDQTGREEPKTLVIKKTASVGPSTFNFTCVWPKVSILAEHVNSIINYRGA